MTKEELEQAIRTVMVFDGWHDCSPKKHYYNIISGTKLSYRKLYYIMNINPKKHRFYHTSWDWLMPVIEKYLSSDKQEYHTLENVAIHYDWVKHKSNIHNAILGFDVMEAFTALYEGITWFNGLNKEG